MSSSSLVAQAVLKRPGIVFGQVVLAREVLVFDRNSLFPDPFTDRVAPLTRAATPDLLNPHLKAILGIEVFIGAFAFSF
jgi:hypothetical protein